MQGISLNTDSSKSNNLTLLTKQNCALYTIVIFHLIQTLIFLSLSKQFGYSTFQINYSSFCKENIIVVQIIFILERISTKFLKILIQLKISEKRFCKSTLAINSIQLQGKGVGEENHNNVPPI